MKWVLNAETSKEFPDYYCIDSSSITRYAIISIVNVDRNLYSKLLIFNMKTDKLNDQMEELSASNKRDCFKRILSKNLDIMYLPSNK
jgi:hypothetical protein